MMAAFYPEPPGGRRENLVKVDADEPRFKRHTHRGSSLPEGMPAPYPSSRARTNASAVSAAPRLGRPSTSGGSIIAQPS